MAPPLRILVLEDQPGDTELIRRELCEAGIDCQIRGVETREAFAHALRESPPDVILSDYSVPGFDGMAAFQLVRKEQPDIPFILVTGSQTEEVAVDCIKKGVDDYILKVSLKRLPAAILGAIQKKRLEKDHKESEERMRRANEELQRLNQVKTHLVSMVSHELRTPLTIIQSAVDLLKDGLEGPVSSSQKETLLLAKKNIDRLARLINNTLDYSRLELGTWESFPQRTDLTALLREVHQMMQPLAARKSVTLDRRNPEKPLTLVCDPDQIRQVLINLVDNANKYTSDGGSIILRGCPDGERHVRFEVQDDGIGIPEEEQELIFEMFHQGSRKGEWRGGGAGIGLAVCKMIVERHGGVLSVNSAPGKGSCFVVKLPRDLNPKVTTAAT